MTNEEAPPRTELAKQRRRIVDFDSILEKVLMFMLYVSKDHSGMISIMAEKRAPVCFRFAPHTPQPYFLNLKLFCSELVPEFDHRKILIIFHVACG